MSAARLTLLDRTSHSVQLQAAEPGLSVALVLTLDATYLERTGLHTESATHLAPICSGAAQAAAPALLRGLNAAFAEFRSALDQAFEAQTSKALEVVAAELATPAPGGQP